MPEQKPKAPRRPKNESTATPKTEVKEIDFDVYSKALSELEDRVAKIEAALGASLGITLS